MWKYGKFWVRNIYSKMIGMIWKYHFFSKEAFLQSKIEQKWAEIPLVWRKNLLIARTVCSAMMPNTNSSTQIRRITNLFLKNKMRHWNTVFGLANWIDLQLQILKTHWSDLSRLSSSWLGRQLAPVLTETVNIVTKFESFESVSKLISCKI